MGMAVLYLRAHSVMEAVSAVIEDIIYIILIEEVITVLTSLGPMWAARVVTRLAVFWWSPLFTVHDSPGWDRCVQPAWSPDWQLEHAHYLTHLVGTIVCSPHGQCGAHSLLDPPGWDPFVQPAWSV